MELKKHIPSTVILLVGLGITNVSLAQSSQYPMMDTITEAVIKKY